MATATKFEPCKPPMPAMLGVLLTVEEVAEVLRVPPSWVYERTGRRMADRIPGFGLGKYWRFRDVDEWWFEIGL